MSSGSIPISIPVQLPGAIMRKTTSPILMLCLLSASTAVSAAGRMKPGLWEMTMTVSAASIAANGSAPIAAI
jgi:hypothetical protein